MKKKILILVQMLAVMSLCIGCGSTKDNQDVTNQVTKADSYTQGAKTYVWETDENTINEAVEAGTEAVENKELLKQKLRLDDNLKAAAGKDIFSDDIKTELSKVYKQWMDDGFEQAKSISEKELLEFDIRNPECEIISYDGGWAVKYSYQLPKALNSKLTQDDRVQIIFKVNDNDLRVDKCSYHGSYKYFKESN